MVHWLKVKVRELPQTEWNVVYTLYGELPVRRVNQGWWYSKAQVCILSVCVRMHSVLEISVQLSSAYWLWLLVRGNLLQSVAFEDIAVYWEVLTLWGDFFFKYIDPPVAKDVLSEKNLFRRI